MNLFKKLFGRKKPEPARAAAVSAIRARVCSGGSFGDYLIPPGPFIAAETEIEGNIFINDVKFGGIFIESSPVLTGEVEK